MSNVGNGKLGEVYTGRGNAIKASFASIGTNSGLTNHGVLLSQGTNPFVSVSPGTTGFVLTANGAGLDPTFQSVSASGAVITLTGNTGGALSPTLGNFNIVGTGSTTVAGSGSTLTAQLTGLTNHAVLIGAGTATITKVGPTATSGQVLQSAGSSADPAFSTATYPATTTINQVLYSSAANVVGGITAANNGTLISSAAGIPSWLANGTTGQLLTATTGSPPSWAPAPASTSYSFQFVTPSSGAGVPVDATNYYLYSVAWSTTTPPSASKFIIPSTGTIRSVYCSFIVGSLGSAETTTVAIRLNDTTNTTVATVAFNSTPQTFASTGLSIAVTAGDYINVYLAAQTYSSNPSNIVMNFTIFIS